MMVEAIAPIIAVCGKGGVGKTTISAAIVRILLEEKSRRVLAIDADPSLGLAFSLGVQPEMSVDSIRKELIESLQDGPAKPKSETMGWLDYRILEALCERDNLAFLAIGRPETEGCFCRINALLKDIIHALGHQFDAVVIDGEAGLEQINRRVMQRITHLLIVSDASRRGLHASAAILEVANRMLDNPKAGLLLNRIHDAEEAAEISPPKGLSLLGWLSEDEPLRKADIEGRSILDSPEFSFIEPLRECLRRWGVLS